MTQETFPYQAHSETSHAAAAAIEPSAATLRQKVLLLLRNTPNGATDEQIQWTLDMNPSTQRPRRIELVARGLVRDSGRKGKTQSGRSAVIWIAADEENL